MSRNALNLNLLNYNMKILQVAFLLLFKYVCVKWFVLIARVVIHMIQIGKMKI